MVSLSSRCFAYSCCCLLGQETWAQHLGLTLRHAQNGPVSTLRGRFLQGPLVQHAKMFTMLELNWKIISQYTLQCTKRSVCATWNSRKAQYTVQFASLIGVLLISTRYRWATPWVSSGPPTLSALNIKHSSDQVIRWVLYGWKPQRVWPPFPLFLQPQAARMKKEKGEDKAKSSLNDS